MNNDNEHEIKTIYLKRRSAHEITKFVVDNYEPTLFLFKTKTLKDYGIEKPSHLQRCKWIAPLDTIVEESAPYLDTPLNLKKEGVILKIKSKFKIF